MVREKRVKKNLFGRFYSTYLMLIIALLVVMFFYIRTTLVKYEKSQPMNYVVSMLEDAGKNDKALGQYLQENCFSENSSFAAGDGNVRSKNFYNTVARATLEAKKDLLNSDGDLSVYNVKADGKQFITVAIEKKGSEKKLLGLLEIAKYDLKYAFLRSENSEQTRLSISENGTINYSIVLPDDFELYIDDGKVDLSQYSEKSPIEDFAAFSSYDAVPMGVKVSLDLCFEPNVKILNNKGEEVSVKFENNVFSAAADYSSSDEAKKVADEIGSFTKMYKLWALFMTADVDGSYYGLYRVLDGCKIMPDSELEAKASQWAHSIDITFVSDHDYPSFSKESVDNYVLYNDKFFSCDVYLEENIPVWGAGNRTVVYNNRMFFIYNEDTSVAAKGWYWVGQLDLTNR